jgi:hypothetical protein
MLETTHRPLHDLAVDQLDVLVAGPGQQVVDGVNSSCFHHRLLASQWAMVSEQFPA